MGDGFESLVQTHVQHLDGVGGFERQLDGEVVHADLVCLGRVALEDEIHIQGDGALLDRDIEGVKCRQIVHALRITCSSNGNLLAVGALDLVANLTIQHIRDEAVIVVHIITPPLLRNIPHLFEYGRHVLLASLVVLRSDIAVHLLPFGVLAVEFLLQSLQNKVLRITDWPKNDHQFVGIVLVSVAKVRCDILNRFPHSLRGLGLAVR